MADEEHGLAEEHLGVAQAAREDVLRDLAVHGREAIVEEVHVGVRVHCPGNRHALLLASTEIDALLADLRGVAGRQLLEVRRQRAGLERSREKEGEREGRREWERERLRYIRDKAVTQPETETAAEAKQTLQPNTSPEPHRQNLPLTSPCIHGHHGTSMMAA